MKISSVKEFVLNQLRKIPIERGLTEKGGDYWLRCPFHSSGRENTPSLKINYSDDNRPIGSYYCFGCGVHSDFNTLADKLKLKKLKTNNLYKDYITADITDEDKDGFFGVQKKEHKDAVIVDWDKNKDWREINGNLLHELGAKLVYEKIIQDLQLYMPVKMFGEEIGHINCLLQRKSKKIRGYFNSPGKWVKSALFPYDYVKTMPQTKNVLFLVEGPRDALSLIQNGIPALAILGTQNWDKECANFVYDLDSNLIVLAFDPDEAGEKATNKIYWYFKNKTPIKILKLPDNKDPAKLNKKEYNFLRQKYVIKDKKRAG